MRKLLPTLLLTLAAVAGCSAEDPAINATRAALVGTWLEASEPGDASVRRVADVLAETSSHNPWPLELLITAGVVPGAALRLLARRISRQGRHPWDA